MLGLHSVDVAALGVVGVVAAGTVEMATNFVNTHPTRSSSVLTWYTPRSGAASTSVSLAPLSRCSTAGLDVEGSRRRMTLWLVAASCAQRHEGQESKNRTVHTLARVR